MSLKSSRCQPGGGPVIRCGYLKKLKTSRKKFFVLRAETSESSARLEYYDSEKKFNSGQPPKRSIQLKTCFNINKRHDTKSKHVIALYTKDDCFCVVLESEEDLDAWLKALISQQQGEDVAEGDLPRPTFEHVWHVHLLERGLGAAPLMAGFKSDHAVYRLCLTDKMLTLIRIDSAIPTAELSLSSIRSCGALRNFFYLEAGRASGIGAGEVWMEAEDTNIAQNIYQTVFHAMTSNSSSSREELAPKSRNRSSSATESSKPSAISRRQTLTGTPKPIPYQIDHNAPSSVAETPVPSTSTSNTTAGNLAWPGIVNHQRTRSLPLAHPAPITTTDNPLHPPRAVKRSTNQSSKCFADSRGRSDSMPSRSRTTSEGNHNLPMWSCVTGYILAHHRPQSMHGRDISHSPPSGSPVSPPSAACSTDSAGSSLSIDETEAWHDGEVHRGRFPTSLTPDEAIAEENCDDCTDSPCMLHSSPIPSSYVPMAPISSDDGYVAMSPHGRHAAMSPAASMSSVTSGTPSTDMRFAEYPLEKVTSYLTPSEEDETSSAERPRTYSMGSKPFKALRDQQARDRAWSVGSRSKKGYNRVLPPHGPLPQHGIKSSSAPMLSNTRLDSSHSSIDRMDDLMEMDFSKRRPDGHVDMRPSQQYRAPHGYVEMRPGHIIERPQDLSPYVEMRPGSSPVARHVFIQNDPVQSSDYMDMDSRRSTGSRSVATPVSPMSSIASTSPQYASNYIYNGVQQNYNQNLEYLDMNPRNTQAHNMYTASPARSTLSGYSHGSPSSLDYMDMDYSNNTPAHTRQDSDGYVEMSLGRSNNTHPSSTTGDYTIMTLGSKKKERKPKKENSRSQPITIQNAASQLLNSAYYMMIPRKNSTGTPPKMVLPLQNSSYPSLPRQQRTRQNSRRDSKDSSSSSITTPSSSSTIFPFSLNSPSSPVYPPPSRSPGTTKKPLPPQDTSEYVNFAPGPPTLPPPQENDYAMMGPSTQFSGLRLNDAGSCFKPIDADDDEEETTVPATTTNKRPSSESSEVGSTTSTLVNSRPDSVNSEKIQLHYASLDLATIGDDKPENPPTTNSAAPATGFTYAQIDFVRTGEPPKILNNNNNAKIK